MKSLSVNLCDWYDVTESDFKIVKEVIAFQKLVLHTAIIYVNSNLWKNSNETAVLSIFPTLAACENLKSLTIDMKSFHIHTSLASSRSEGQSSGALYLEGDVNQSEPEFKDIQEHVEFLEQFLPVEFYALEHLKIKSNANYRLIDYVLLKLRAPRLKRLNMDLEHYGRAGIQKMIDFLHFHSGTLELFKFNLYWEPICRNRTEWPPEILKKATEVGTFLKNVVTLEIQLNGCHKFLQPWHEIVRQIPKTNHSLKQLTINIYELNLTEEELTFSSSVLMESVGFSSLRVLDVQQPDCVFDFTVLSDNCPLVEDIYLRAKYIENIHLLPRSCKRLSMYKTVPSQKQWRDLATMDHNLETLFVKIGTENFQHRGSRLEISVALCKRIYRPATMKRFSIYPVICFSRAQHRTRERLLPVIPSIRCRHDRAIDPSANYCSDSDY